MTAETEKETRQTFRIPDEVLSWVLHWGKEQGGPLVDKRGDPVMSKCVVEALVRFRALEAGGQHVTALLDAHTDPVLREARAARRLAAMTLQALHFGAVLPPDWEMRWTPEQDEQFYAEVIAPALEDAS